MINHFDLAYCSIAPFFLSVAAYKRLRYGKYRRSLPGMFGANLPDPPLAPYDHRVWLHSVSMGETMGAGAVYRRMREAWPRWQFLSTTTTETGQDQAHKSLEGADWVDFAPVDLGWKVRKFLDAYKPSIYLFFETEIWPNTLLECRRRNLPVYLVNGKVSERSARGYTKLAPLLRPSLGAVRTFLMQTEADAERLARVAPAGAKFVVTGNVKFDNLPEPLPEADRVEMRRSWGVDDDALLILAGSTHPGEERLVYLAYRYLLQSFPKARLVIAPRHPERFSAVADELRGLGAIVCRLSREEPSASGGQVLLLDKMGVLARSFGAADIALVGGAWNPIGGHNLLEPAAHGIPVVHGPAMHAQGEIMRIIREADASLQTSGDDLGDTLARLASDADLRRSLGERGRKAASANRGAAERVVAELGRDIR
ncbi:MAG: 3-deoxy-D-manno-octulosonic acid transferase [Candidatus Sumerlaeia bacterium]|nr:3-deoxy-D-manno-octulosonic acid transferase [Candidatus Sumerlaeia bacterium]